MGQKMSDGDKLFLGTVVGLAVILLYYLTAGHDRENNAALIPDSLENRIDYVVGTLNATFGSNWVRWGAEQLKAYLQSTLPPHLVRLVDVVYAVEQQARYGYIPRQAKRERVIAMVTA